MTSLISNRIAVVDGSATLFDVAQAMKTNVVGIATVMVDDKLAGVITNRDLVLRVLAEGTGALGLLAKDVMTSDPITVSDESEVTNAVDLMRKHNVRQVVISANGGPVIGVITIDDIWRHDPSMLNYSYSLSRPPLNIPTLDELPVIPNYFLG